MCVTRSLTLFVEIMSVLDSFDRLAASVLTLTNQNNTYVVFISDVWHINTISELYIMYFMLNNSDIPLYLL